MLSPWGRVVDKQSWNQFTSVVIVPPMKNTGRCEYVVGPDLSWEASHGHWVGISQMTKEGMSFADRTASGLADPGPG